MMGLNPGHFVGWGDTATTKVESRVHTLEKLCMYTTLNLYFLKHIIALWRSEENIASIVCTPHTEGRKTTQQTFRRCRNYRKKQVSHAVNACFHLAVQYLENHFANISFFTFYVSEVEPFLIFFKGTLFGKLAIMAW